MSSQEINKDVDAGLTPATLTPEPQNTTGTPKATVSGLVVSLFRNNLWEFAQKHQILIGIQFALGLGLLIYTLTIPKTNLTKSDKNIKRWMISYSVLVMVFSTIPFLNVGLVILSFCVFFLKFNKFSPAVTSPTNYSNYSTLQLLMILSMGLVCYSCAKISWDFRQELITGGKTVLIGSLAATKAAATAGYDATKAAATAGYDAGKKGAGLAFAAHTAATERAGQAGFADVLTMFIVSVSVALLSFLATQI